MPFVDDIINLVHLPSASLPASAMNLARLSLLDWMVCGWAGRDEPLARKLRDLAVHEAGSPAATIIGSGKAPARMAALVNGATSHALDFDDTHFAHVGHLSVGVFPAALAVGEETGASALSMVEAFLVGAEVAIRIGVVLGQEHYDRGFHQTATAGAFGAAAAAARLLSLDTEQTRNALGLCATRASGLKSQFGTMGKPYNAGIAASNGVECARLAALGFTSVADGLFDPQGFIPTHTDKAAPEAVELVPWTRRFYFSDNKYKLHACCHGTHAMIEGLLEAAPEISLAEIAELRLRTNPRWLRVCDKKAPKTGLEVKFSYAWLAGMTVRGDATGNDRVYTDQLAEDPELAAFAERVTVEADAALTDMQAAGELRLKNGETRAFGHDLALPLDPEVLQNKLEAKAVAAIGDDGPRICNSLASLETMSARDLGALLSAKNT